MLDRLLNRGLLIRCLDVTEEPALLADQRDHPLVLALLRRLGFWTSHELAGWSSLSDNLKQTRREGGSVANIPKRPLDPAGACSRCCCLRSGGCSPVEEFGCLTGSGGPSGSTEQQRHLTLALADYPPYSPPDWNRTNSSHPATGLTLNGPIAARLEQRRLLWPRGIHVGAGNNADDLPLSQYTSSPTHSCIAISVLMRPKASVLIEANGPSMRQSTG